MGKAAVRLRTILAVAAVASSTAGCNVVPRAQLDDAHKVVRNLRAESDQLRDTNLALTAQNRDYAERSVDDARRIAALETANRRLEDSVLAYQKDREKLAASFDHLQADLQAPAAAPRQARRDAPADGKRDAK